jgi:hypothetical protein
MRLPQRGHAKISCVKSRLSRRERTDFRGAKGDNLFWRDDKPVVLGG